MRLHFGYAKVRYRGLSKNGDTQRIALLLGFSNLLIAGRYATGLNAGPSRPFPAGTAGNGAEVDEFSVSRSFPNQTGALFSAEMDSRLRSACPTPCGDRKPGLIRPSLAGMASLALFATTMSVEGAEAGPPAAYVGAAACRECHAPQFKAWTQSDHFQSMRPAGEGTVLGDFADARVTFHRIETRFFRRGDAHFIETIGGSGDRRV